MLSNLTNIFRPKSLGLLLTGLLVFSLLLAACGDSNTPVSGGSAASTGGSSPKDATEVVFGASLPLTGAEARPGLFFKTAYEMAIEEINTGGGLMVKDLNKKLPVRMVVYDNKSEVTTTTSNMEKLAKDDKVNFFLGGYETNMVKAESSVAEKYKIPYVNGGGASSQIYAQNYKYVFGLLASIQDLSNTELNWLAVQQDAGKLPKPLKIAIVWENTDHGQDYRKQIEDRAQKEANRWQVVLSEQFELNGKDFTPLLSKVKSVNADAFMADAHLADYILMQRQYIQQGLNHKFVTYGARGPESSARKELGNGADYIVAATWWSKLLPYPQAKEFATKYEEKYKEQKLTAEYYPAAGYEVVQIYKDAFDRAGSLDKVKMRDAIAATNLTNALMPGQVVKFKANGQVDIPYVMTQNLPGDKTILIFPDTAKTGEAVVPAPPAK